MTRLIATVAVENTFFSAGCDYDYYVPDSLKASAILGAAVKIPFGRGNVIRSGIIVKLFEAINTNLKEIAGVDNSLPALSGEAVKLALWLKERCFCSTYDCLRLMMPKGTGKIKDKSTAALRLAVENRESLPHLTPKQRMVVELMFDVGTADVSEVCEFCSVGKTVVANLVKYGVLERFDRKIWRLPYNDAAEVSQRQEIRLSDRQKKAYLTYKKIIDSHESKTGLLYGVTGSGKTQVYIKLIDDVIDRGGDVIVLVPEISLTPQTLAIFYKRYGNVVAVMHSSLSMGEMNDEYKRALEGRAKIVVGTRSAVFAPLKNLQLIIIDEEQEGAYKSEHTPKYDARDIANFRAKYNGALLLLVSATPSIESYSQALCGKYVLSELTERYGDSVLPQVITVDMKEEMRRGNKSAISAKLEELLAENLENKKQAILLINRRGYNTFIACNECGHVITCPNCSISLTYHSNVGKLMCHYCGFTKSLDCVCPECGEKSVRYSGYGTQKIEEEIAAKFPGARVLRMDSDSVSGKFAHQKLFDAFAAGEYDILVGTQMIAKGLDFPNVTLVCVVNADNFLYDESYKAAERSFDLITQLVGRAGRRSIPGKAVIQSVNPYNEVIEYSSSQDFKAFYKNEIELRRLMVYPPFCDIYSVFFTGENENAAALCAGEFFENLVRLNKTEYSGEKIIILGPGKAKIGKINNTYRYRLAIKCKNSPRLRKMLSAAAAQTEKSKKYKQVLISIDLNSNTIS
ncbi:MAG: primosomal protein N' [Clostridiales bacterium]|nr:primosomal protein N' [Clostridiales bacterium]